MISRIVIQKGFDLLTEALDELLRRELQLVILGTGQEQFQEFLQEAAGRYPTKMGVRIAFDEALAHKIEAGADLFLMPSLYEPCGLNQMYSLKYGTIPIVRATGGLRDTVQEFDPRTGQGTGFTFSPYEASALLEAVDRAIEVYHQKRKWTALMKNAMTADFSWDRSAQVYINLYRRLVGG
jgi:starch synthase